MSRSPDKGSKAKSMRAFARYIGIDYSGAGTPAKRHTGLCVFRANGGEPPEEVRPPCSRGRSKPVNWTRQDIAEWLVMCLVDDRPTLVGIDHAFSLPLKYFEVHRVKKDWQVLLEDFRRRWPTHRHHTSVEYLRRGRAGQGVWWKEATKWRRRTEELAGNAKSAFHFDVPGQVATSTHAGIPWLFLLRRKLGSRVHFWPFDGWEIPSGQSAVAEVYPALWARRFARRYPTSDQHDAYCIAAWLSHADGDGSLAGFLDPCLTRWERNVARVEGWILGVPGQIREENGKWLN